MNSTFVYCLLLTSSNLFFAIPGSLDNTENRRVISCSKYTFVAIENINCSSQKTITSYNRCSKFNLWPWKLEPTLCVISYLETNIFGLKQFNLNIFNLFRRGNRFGESITVLVWRYLHTFLYPDNYNCYQRGVFKL